MPFGGNDEEQLLNVSVECDDEAAMIVSVNVAVGENASLQLFGDTTGYDALDISFQLVLACSYRARYLKRFVLGQSSLTTCSQGV